MIGLAHASNLRRKQRGIYPQGIKSIYLCSRNWQDITVMKVKPFIKVSILLLARCIGLFKLGRCLTRKGLMIVGWHGVSIHDEHERFGSLFISPQSFRKRLRFLSKHYKIIGLDVAVRQHKAGKFDPNQVVITFDDGFYNFIKVAAPILNEFGVTATNYIVTNQMITQQAALTLLLRDIVLQSSKQEVELALTPNIGDTKFTLPKDQKRLTTILLKMLKETFPDYDSKLEFAKKIAAQLEVDIESLIKNRIWHSMDEAEVHKMAQDGFLMQAHSHNHHNVVEHPDTVQFEAETCKTELETIIDAPVVHFCYPTGRWNRQAWEPLQRGGMQSATTTKQGPNFPQTPLLALRRVLNGEDRSQLEFEFEMSNLKWLLHIILHPKDLFVPNEKTTGYASEARIF